MKKEFMLIAGKRIEDLFDELQKHGEKGWSIAMYLQEFGHTKVVLERIKKDI